MNEAEQRRRVVLADHDVLLRESLASLLEHSGFEVVGQADDGTQLIRLVREQRPELAIVDIRMPPDHSTEGLDAAREIRAQFPGTGIVLLSAHVEVEHAMEVLEGGDRTGYLLKSREIPAWLAPPRRLADCPAQGVNTSVITAPP